MRARLAPPGIELGVRLAIIIFVAAQFIELTLFSIGNFQVSVQKIAAALLMPLSLLMMQRVRIELRLFLGAGLMLLAFGAYDLIERSSISSDVLSAATTVFFSVIGAVVLCGALTRLSGTVRYLAQVWIFFAVFTAVLTILQAVRLIPLFSVPVEFRVMRKVNDFLNRGTGLKFDPNFQALMLCIGLAFAQVYVVRRKLILDGVILCGIVATFSRMGLLVALTVLMILPILRAPRRHLGRTVRQVAITTILVSGIGYCVYRWGPAGLQTYLQARASDVTNSVQELLSSTLVGEGVHYTSAESRAILLTAAADLVTQNWFTGVGVFRTNQVLGDVTGIQNVSHNSYLEMLLIGGVWGGLFLGFYVINTVAALRVNNLGNLMLAGEVEALSQLLIVFGICGFFLSLTYNSVIWLPLALAFTIQFRVRLLRAKLHGTPV